MKNKIKASISLALTGCMLMVSNPIYANDGAVSSPDVKVSHYRNNLVTSRVDQKETVLEELVKNNLLTKEQAEKVKEYFANRVEKEKAEFDKLKNMTPEEVAENIVKYTTSISADHPFGEMVEQGIITKEEADKINDFYKEKAETVRADEIKKSIDRYVKEKILNSKEAEKVLEFMLNDKFEVGNFTVGKANMLSVIGSDEIHAVSPTLLFEPFSDFKLENFALVSIDSGEARKSRDMGMDMLIGLIESNDFTRNIVVNGQDVAFGQTTLSGPSYKVSITEGIEEGTQQSEVAGEGLSYNASMVPELSMLEGYEGADLAVILDSLKDFIPADIADSVKSLDIAEIGSLIENFDMSDIASLTDNFDISQFTENMTDEQMADIMAMLPQAMETIGEFTEEFRNPKIVREGIVTEEQYQKMMESDIEYAKTQFAATFQPAVDSLTNNKVLSNEKAKAFVDYLVPLTGGLSSQTISVVKSNLSGELGVDSKTTEGKTLNVNDVDIDIYEKAVKDGILSAAEAGYVKNAIKEYKESLNK